jgi:hypothetical protein
LNCDGVLGGDYEMIIREFETRELDGVAVTYPSILIAIKVPGACNDEYLGAFRTELLT